MRRTAALLLTLLLAACTAGQTLSTPAVETPAPQPTSTLQPGAFSEDFSDPERVNAEWRVIYLPPRDQLAPISELDPAWDDLTAGPREGVYRIIKSVANTSILSIYTGSQPVDDVTITIQVTQGSDIPSDVRLICRYGERGWYEFMVNDTSGAITFNFPRPLPYRVEGASSDRLLASAPGTMISDGPHLLSITCAGDQLSLSVDGTQLVSVQDSTLTSGAIGFGTGYFGDAGSAWDFDDLTVVPAEATVAATTTSTAPQGALLYTGFAPDDPLIGAWTMYTYARNIQFDGDTGPVKWVPAADAIMFDDPDEQAVYAMLDHEITGLEDPGDMVIRTDMTFQYTGEASFGVVCRYSPFGWYEFTLSRPGNAWSITRVDGYLEDAIRTVLAEGTDAAVNDYANQIEASCVGEDLTLLVNGVQVGQISDPSLTTGQKMGFVYAEPPGGNTVRADLYAFVALDPAGEDIFRIDQSDIRGTSSLWAVNLGYPRLGVGPYAAVTYEFDHANFWLPGHNYAGMLFVMDQPAGTDVQVSALFRNDGRGVTLLCRADENGAYGFTIGPPYFTILSYNFSEDGSFAVTADRLQQNDNLVFTDETVNTLTAVCSGSTLTLLVNGQTMLQVDTSVFPADMQHNGDQVGFGYAPGWQEDGTQYISIMWLDDFTVMPIE